MNASLIKLGLLVLTLSLSMFSGYWFRGVFDENKQLNDYLAKAGEAFVLQGQVILDSWPRIASAASLTVSLFRKAPSSIASSVS